MRPQELEADIENLLIRLVPGLDAQWNGASADEIERIERIAGRPLPGFYQWFLLRMGTSMGPLAYPSLDCSAKTILSCYLDGVVVPDPRFLMIGYENDEIMPLHLFYDFEHPAREDARVVKMDAMGGPLHVQFDSFREKLALGKFVALRVKRLPQACEGSFDGTGSDVLGQLDSVMASLGFSKPITSGPNCALYERTDAAMSVNAAAGDPPGHYHFFDFGASDAGTLRRILGTIANKTSFDLEVEEWTPPLPTPSTPL